METAQSYNLIPVALPAPLDCIHAGLELSWGQIRLFNLRTFASDVHCLMSPLSEAFPDHISLPQTYSPVLLYSYHLSVPDIMN